MNRASSLFALLLSLSLLSGPAVPALASPPAGAPQDADDEALDPQEVVDPSFFSSLQYRSVGPTRGGRVTAVTGVAGEPHTFFMGATGGGVWRSFDAGETWHNVSDGHFGVGSIGAIEVAASDPNVIYVGTGSACPRGNVSAGDGVYKSTDGGDTWTHVGLPEAGQIGRIRVHPDDSDLVYVAALGHMFGPNEERGVFRSEDGGATWEKVLYVSETTGAVDLSMDPNNPRVLFAAMWRAERKPWTLIDGGEQSGLWVSRDGGDTWDELTHAEGTGLPGGVIGRIGVSVSPADGKVVYALITHEGPEGGAVAGWVEELDRALEVTHPQRHRGDRGGVYRSDDGGRTWRRVSADRELRTRGWYYSHIYADPSDAHTAWVMNAGFFRSVDGGSSWERVSTPHGDNHDLWINPHHPEIMVEGNDGGACVSVDGGETWTTQLNQPTAEFYRVTVDDRFPYRLYGAQQDNSTISVPSATAGGLGITPTQHWYPVAGGESGHIAVHPDDPDIIYAGNYIGQIDRYDHSTGYARNVIIYPQMADGMAPHDLAYRFQWNAPILIDPHDHDVVYHTSHRVHRSRDGGRSWETISPDLTHDDPEKQELPGGPVQHDHTGVEVYNTVFSLAISPHTPGEIWAGADDGLVHLSRDDGGSWQDVTPADMPMDGTVNVIELSPHRPGKAYLAVHRYRLDDFAPYVFRTTDHGESWELLTDGDNGIPGNHFVRVVREDPDREGLLYAGTEFGMYVSFDDGTHWQPLQLNLPVTPITDLVVQEQDLVVATQGRSFWLLEDLTPLHRLAEAVAAQGDGAEGDGAEDVAGLDAAREAGVLLFQPADVVRSNLGGFSLFGGRNGPPSRHQGAFIHYWLEEEPAADAEPITLEILDADGEVVQTFESRREDDGSGRPEPEPAGLFRGRRDEPAVPAKAGMNRFVWDLRYPGPEALEGAQFSLAFTGGTAASPGEYRARLTVGDWSETRSFRVLIDPRVEGEVTAADLQEQFDLSIRTRDLLTAAHDAVRTLRSVRRQADDLLERAGEAGIDGEGLEGLRDAARALKDELAELEEELIQVRSEAGQDPINFPPRLDDQLAYLYSHLQDAYGRPTEGARRRFADLEALLDARMARLDELLEQELARFNELAREAGATGILVPRTASRSEVEVE